MRNTKKLLFVLSIILFLLIITGGILSNYWIKRTSTELLDPINKTLLLIGQDQWETVPQKYQNLTNIWHKRKPFWSILLDHSEIDNINTEMAKLHPLINEKQKYLALTELASLKQFIMHIPNNLSVTIENIF